MKYIAIAALLLLAACDKPNTAEQGYDEKLHQGEVALAAIAPDGTKLWAVRVGGKEVYFSSHGTQVTEGCGKGCTYERQTPNDQ